MQSAVNWLEQKAKEFSIDLDLLDYFEQAKEMEKKQIIDAFGVGCHLESKRLIGYHDVAEQYYNETYGSKGSDEQFKKD